MGLRGNPFRVAEPAELVRLYVGMSEDSEATADEIVQSASPLVQVIGPRGRGKTTLLLAVGDRLRRLGQPAHYVYFPPETRVRLVVPDPSTRVLLLDEAQRMTARAGRRARRWREQTGGRIIAATHEDLARFFGPEIWTVHLPPADAAVITEMFDVRIEWAGGDRRRIRLLPEAAAWLAEHTGGNLRQVEEICYEVFQRVEPAEAIVITEAIVRQSAHGSGSTA